MLTAPGNSELARRAELAQFLRARRARLQPADVGLTAFGDPARRRAPGLRREEVAELSGISLTWYTWLEQGRDVMASRQVIDALARALRLDPVQHRHLRGLAGLSDPEPGDRHADPERLRRFVDAVLPYPAAIYTANFDYLAWNTAYALVRGDPGRLSPDRRNLLWTLFAVAESRALPEWEHLARAALGQFRAAVGRHPGDARAIELVERLSAVSPEFRCWWPEYEIREFDATLVRIDHPEAGPMTFELFQMRPVDDPRSIMVLHRPFTPADRARLETLLRRGAG
ncbi:helix-turn-helix transcriptional regulator [Nocardia sp. NPDC003482]